MTTATETHTDFANAGSELDLFAEAANWKRYWASQIGPFLGTRIAEIGAGIGANVALLGKPGQEWTSLEPDPTLAARIEARIRMREFPFSCRVTTGTCAHIATGSYDSILYIDVLEHIADNRAEVTTAAQRLRSRSADAHACPRSPPRRRRHARVAREPARAQIADADNGECSPLGPGHDPGLTSG